MNNIILLTCESELESAKKLGFETYSYLDNKKVENFLDSVVINWGFGSHWYDKDNKPSYFKNALNDYKPIRLNIQKDKSAAILAKAVRTPKLYKAGQNVPRGKLMVVRPTNHHSGRDFSVKRGPFKVNNGQYAREYIKTKHEYRVLFINGQFLAWKRQTDDKKELKKKFVARSEWGFRYLEKIPKQLKEITIKSYKALNLMFGAFDILMKNGKYYVLEGNTAPTLSDQYLVKMFRENLLKLCKKKFKDFNPEKYKKFSNLPNAITVNLFENVRENV